ncbi:SapC family protein [Phenylobacterium deserti]|uniref:Multidrug transporter n=1 Tax=Phenylobacterium deserti TaxID=1914756 RepID=A0A328ABZ0_9CAUL|nr:SapC family protein [Phenylobacterium deserti]RAK52171.1 multidrug transporter [Phenylobacterium deserti]
MAESPQPLSAVQHSRLRLRRLPEGAPYFVQIVAGEFATAAATCPIFITKAGDTGEFYAGAMFGFEPGEYLLHPGDAFRPLDLERQGFFIDGDKIAIDPSNPRFSEQDGEPLFEAGEPGESLRRMQRLLGHLKAGVDQTQAFIQALLRHKLLAPMDIELAFDDGRNLNLQGLYTVSLDALQDLDDAAVVELFRSGHLQLAHVMAASLKQVPVLARRRNARLAA